MLQDILKKKSLSEEDLAFISKNLDQLSETDLVRLGFKSAEERLEEMVEKPEEKPKRVSKKK